MRELPEVETIRRALDKEISGKRVKTVEVTGTMSAFPRHPNKKHLAGKLEGVKLTGTRRKGLTILVDLDSDDVLVIDLGDGGSMLRTAAKDPVTPDTLVCFAFTQGGQLRFLDATGTATMSVIAVDDLDTELPQLGTLGLDPVETPVSWTLFAAMLRGQKMKLKAFLVDQTIVAGLGELYADEILFASGLRPDRIAGSLTTQEIRRLYRSLVETLHDALKYRGTSLESDTYVDLAGKPGEYQEHIKVYEREKLACRRCRTPIVKIRSGNTATYLCEQCQV
ncbi:MAG: bifunctional DNA-formamidopyrimidine glycosylase/DNA-(apurinic or apyrimidinic site) lyase [Acidimicrobiales bacterium]